MPEEGAPGAHGSASASAVSSAAPAAGGRGDGSGSGQRGQRFGEASVYVDGKPVAVLRYLELPPALKIHKKKLEDGRLVNRFRVVEYLEAVGVDLAKVKQLHIHGGRGRASMIDAGELRKHREDLLFSFTKGDGGRARMHYPPGGIETNTSIDGVVAFAVYVERAPPQYVREKREFRLEDGSTVKGVPYSTPDESLRGTRVYLDGKLVGSVKRRRLGDGVLSRNYTPKTPRFSVAKYLATLGADPAKLQHVAFVRGDRIGARLDAGSWKKHGEAAEFSLVQGSEGRVLLHLNEAPEPTGIPVSAILAFSSARPTRSVLDAELDPTSDGSTEPQEPDAPEPP